MGFRKHERYSEFVFEINVVNYAMETTKLQFSLGYRQFPQMRHDQRTTCNCNQSKIWTHFSNIPNGPHAATPCRTVPVLQPAPS